MMGDERISFVVEYADPQSGLTRTYQLCYYTEDKTIEMYDLKTKRLFLKRCAYPSLSVKELYVGATINVFSRPLRLVGYGDEATRRRLSMNTSECMLGIDMEHHSTTAGTVIDALTSQDLRIASARLVELPQNLVHRIGASTARVLFLSVSGADALDKVAALAASHPAAVIQIINLKDAQEIRQTLMGPGKTTAALRDCAVCVIKPHAITSSYQGAILQRLVEEGFHITALGSYQLSVADAEDFLEVYSGVLPEYKKLVEQMSSGPCWAIEVCAENAVSALRAVCGPHDPEVCHVLFPHTLRAKYGVDRVRNAVHCTDLEEDGPLESEFFFSLLQNKQ
ncbi:putative nucleoside diphosphate kinase [Leptomonas seymouri]|uniref:Putative nucleoside diphosphate kinase n=1 Tax=Leptomonas seymouri TaxID=5684 RepID=A0A0N1PC23_LEPSE|nr:putative nucleoside diphosphate kinase [Leptomonas seymouri]|eukprot:KPI84635.1 putative nucleoside diphosphate kinase [Leptomonas seymouri]